MRTFYDQANTLHVLSRKPMGSKLAFISIDLEMYNRSRTAAVKEIGIRTFTVDGMRSDSIHYRVNEHTYKKNRYSLNRGDAFVGKSIFLSLQETKAAFNNYIKSIQQALAYEIADDGAYLFKAKNLVRCLESHGQPYPEAEQHNASNDAFRTIELLGSQVREVYTRAMPTTSHGRWPSLPELEALPKTTTTNRDGTYADECDRYIAQAIWLEHLERTTHGEKSHVYHPETAQLAHNLAKDNHLDLLQKVIPQGVMPTPELDDMMVDMVNKGTLPRVPHRMKGSRPAVMATQPTPKPWNKSTKA
ncbi:hypothetical protein F4778DRAFT_788876 [Xylariomycetidae sp. FL2044]|nr:hypothetical protein F4778DRAFT_788876 [Xylariomycetidae sp. FL2044]